MRENKKKKSQGSRLWPIDEMERKYKRYKILDDEWFSEMSRKMYEKYEIIDIDILKKEANIIGTGSLDDPWIIEELDALNEKFQNIRLIDSSSHILFEKCKFNAVILTSCQNVTFKNCTFEKKISLVQSSNLAFKSSKIQEILLDHSPNILFEDSEITEFTVLNSKDFILQNCSLEKGVHFLSVRSFFARLYIESKSILIAFAILNFLGWIFFIVFEKINYVYLIGLFFLLSGIYIGLYYSYKKEKEAQASIKKFSEKLK